MTKYKRYAIQLPKRSAQRLEAMCKEIAKRTSKSMVPELVMEGLLVAALVEREENLRRLGVPAAMPPASAGPKEPEKSVTVQQEPKQDHATNTKSALEAMAAEKSAAAAKDATIHNALASKLWERGSYGTTLGELHEFQGEGNLDCTVCGKSRPHPGYHFLSGKRSRKDIAEHENPNIVRVIGQLDRILSEMIHLARQVDGNKLDEPDRQALKHHAEDMKGAGDRVLGLLGFDAQAQGMGGPEAPPTAEQYLAKLDVCEATWWLLSTEEQAKVDGRFTPGKVKTLSDCGLAPKGDAPDTSPKGSRESVNVSHAQHSPDPAKPSWVRHRVSGERGVVLGYVDFGQRVRVRHEQTGETIGDTSDYELVDPPDTGLTYSDGIDAVLNDLASLGNGGPPASEHNRWVDELRSALAALANRPIPMKLQCPNCFSTHEDEGEWATKPHTSHTCQGCGLTWKPALVPTVGVRFLPGTKNS